MMQSSIKIQYAKIILSPGNIVYMYNRYVRCCNATGKHTGS